MKIVKTSKLSGNELDYAFCMAKGVNLEHVPKNLRLESLSGSVNALSVLDIMEKELISTTLFLNSDGTVKFWFATIYDSVKDEVFHHDAPSLMEAVVRCFVYYKLGLEIEIPDASDSESILVKKDE